MSATKKRSKPSVPLSDIMQECSNVLRFLTSKAESDPFLEPVDWRLYQLHDYPDIIKNPMDLGTVEGRLMDGKYKDINTFASDVRLVFENCMTYNRPDSDLYATAEKLLKQFDKKFQKLKQVGSIKKGPDGEVQKEGTHATRADRLKFSQLVNQLSPEQLGSVIEMLKKDCPGALNEEDDDEIEIEINLIDGNTLNQLISFANTSIQGGAEAAKKLKLVK
jgi:hypothetical protein